MTKARVNPALHLIQFLMIPGFLLPFLITGCGSASKIGGTPVPTVAITASPASIAAGGSSTLIVTATNATQVMVTATDGTSYALAASGGTHVVSPTVTTTYTASVTGAGGTTTATAIVTVTANPAPAVTIAASPTPIASGSTSTLTVTATNATHVTVTGSDGTSYTMAPSGGTQAVSPGVTTTYTASATGAGGTTTATAIVTVAANPAPAVTIAANPLSITSGSSAILTVTAANSTQVTVTGSDGSTYPLLAIGGTQAVSPTTTTTYTAVAKGAGGQASAIAIVSVTPNPAPTVTITADPASITSGSSSALTVTTVNATQVTVTGTDGSSYSLPAGAGLQGVSPATTTTYTATAIGAGGQATATAIVTVSASPVPTVTMTANPTSIVTGNSSTLTVAAANATQVTITGSDNTTFALSASGGTQLVSPTATTIYTAAAVGNGGNASASATVAVTAAGSIQSIDHVIFMMQENHTFDNYFGMLNSYRKSNGWNIGDDGTDYEVDGLDDTLTPISNVDDAGTSYSPFKFTSACIDDESSDWLASYGDVNRYDFSAQRQILVDGFVHNAEGYDKSCALSGSGCSGSFTDPTGRRAMGYYDQTFLNYYYYMASQFALSDRWFSPVSTKSVDNRIATFTGGTTQGLVKDPGGDDHLPQLDIRNIFQELDQAKVSWKIYYTVTVAFCLTDDDCPGWANAAYPATYFSNLTYSYRYIYENPSGAACTPPTQQSSVVGDTSNSFCIDPDHVAPISTYYSDLTNGTLPSFAFIEAGYGRDDEHPGSDHSVLVGQAEVAKVVNAFMASSSWKDSVFFLSYDEGGGPYDHVPPVPGNSNDNTNTALLGATPPDIGSIAVNADGYKPCVPATPGTPTLHCDLDSSDPGANSGDAAAEQGFAAQLGFRLPNIIISPFARKHYVSHIPMDHTAVIKFVENRFIGSAAHLTARDAAQPNLLDFFDFNNVPWSTPPSPPIPVTAQSLGYDPCTPGNMGP